MDTLSCRSLGFLNTKRRIFEDTPIYTVHSRMASRIKSPLSWVLVEDDFSLQIFFPEESCIVLL